MTILSFNVNANTLIPNSNLALYKISDYVSETTYDWGDSVVAYHCALGETMKLEGLYRLILNALTNNQATVQRLADELATCETLINQTNDERIQIITDHLSELVRKELVNRC